MIDENVGKWMCTRSNYDEQWNDFNRDLHWEAFNRYDTSDEAIQAGTKVVKEIQENWENLESAEGIDDEDVLGYLYRNDRDDMPTSFSIGYIYRDWKPSIKIGNELERINEGAQDNYGEIAQDYLMDLPEEQVYELNMNINKVFDEWLDKYDAHPKFFSVVLIDDIMVPQEENK